MNRRAFLRTGSVAGSLLIFPRGLRAQGRPGPNARLQSALIGIGGRGATPLTALDQEEFVAFCDVDYGRGREEVDRDPKLGPILERFASARWFKDYRVMFEQMADRIDAVVISVPDHMHFAIAMTAIRYGKHVLVEKPLCRCITEVRTLHAAARQAGVVTQMGNQGRAADGIRLAREWVQAGLIGHVHTVHAYNNTVWQAYSYAPGSPAGSKPADEVPPPTLDYDLWIGVAPQRPYYRYRHHSWWRGCTDYGGGRLGDWGCHQLDAANYARDSAPMVGLGLDRWLTLGRRTLYRNQDYEQGALHPWSAEADEEWIYLYYSTGRRELGLVRAPKRSLHQPIVLWSNQAVAATGHLSRILEPDRRPFALHVVSDRDGDLRLVVWNPATADWIDLEPAPVAGGSLFTRDSLPPHAKLRVRFTPRQGDALVSAWLVPQ